MPFTRYVLRSESTGRRYVGQTADLQRRLEEHNSIDHNRRKHTSRNAGPWRRRLLRSEDFDTRAKAMTRERWLKSGVVRAWLDSQFG